MCCLSFHHTAKDASDDCQTCQLLIGFIESYVEANKTLEQIEGYLNKLCLLTPFAKDCIKFVDTYTPIIVQYIQNNEDPKTVCKQIGVCSSFVEGPKSAVAPKGLKIN